MKKPLPWFPILFFVCVLFSVNVLFAKIPEPSNVVYGTIHIGGKQILKTNTEVTIVARLANTVVGSYQMGSNAAYGDQYLLKIPLDSVGNRNANSTHKDDVINLFVSDILANAITIGERGTIRENNLAVDATDTDNDGMPDYWEIQYGLLVNSNDANLDKDNDGLSNLQEYLFGSNPTIPDSDGDGMIDLFEHTHGFNPNDPADAALDSDGDGLTNFQESQNGTHPHAADSDGDGMSDAYEVQYGLNPNDAADAALDSDSDGYTNLEEYQNGTDPTIPDGAVQSQLVMISQAGVFQGDISGLVSDQTSTFVASHNSSQIHVINNLSGALENTIPITTSNGINAIARLNDLLFIATGDNRIVIWDNSLGSEKAVLREKDCNASILSLAVDEVHLVAGTADGKLYVWANHSGSFDYQTSWQAGPGFITAVGLSSTQVFSVSSTPNRVMRVWDRTYQFKLLFELPGDVPCCSLSKLSHNQSNLVLTGAKAEKRLTSVSIADKEDKNLLSQKSRATVVEATTSHFISGDDSGEIYIWNQQSGVLVHHFKAHSHAIGSLKITGNHLITGSSNGEVKVWHFPYQ